MKLNDYKNALDNIHCSDTFKEKMEKQLSKDSNIIPEGYQDSVSNVEIAPKRNWLKFTAIAASALLILGGTGTGVYHYFNNMDDDIPNISESIKYTTPFGEIESISLSFHGNTYSSGFDLTALSDEATSKIIEYINESQFKSTLNEDFNSLGLFDSQFEKYSDAIILNCNGTDSFIITLLSDGDINVSFNDHSSEECYISDDLYQTINEYISTNLYRFNFSNAEITGAVENDEYLSLSDNKKEAINKVLTKYEDEFAFIKDTQNDETILPDNTIHIKLNIANRFTLYIGEEQLGIFYHDIIEDCDKCPVYSIPIDLFNELYNIMISEEEDITEETTESKTEADSINIINGISDEICTEIEEMEKKTISFYPVRELIGYKITNELNDEKIEGIIDFLRDTEWSEVTSYELDDIPYNNAYHLGNITFGINGIVNCSNGPLVKMNDEEKYNELLDKLHGLVVNNDCTYAMYRILAPEKTCKNFEANYSIYYNYEVKTDISIEPNGSGIIFLDNTLDEENIVISEFDNHSLFKGSKIEFVRQKDKNCIIQSGHENKSIDNTFSFPYFDSIRSQVLYQLEIAQENCIDHKVQYEDEYTIFDITYKRTYGDDIYHLKTIIDNYGSPLLYELNTIESDNNNELIRRYEFTDIKYNSQDFVMPELTPEQEFHMADKAAYISTTPTNQ